jgi:hypothetical protein
MYGLQTLPHQKKKMSNLKWKLQASTKFKKFYHGLLMLDTKHLSNYSKCKLQNYLKLYIVKYLVIVDQPSQHHNHRAMVLQYHLPEILIGVW